MNFVKISSAIALSVCFAGAAVAAADKASADEAKAMVAKGVAFIKSNGKDKGFAEISNPNGQFKDRDLYLTVYGMDGVVHAHGANAKMVGKNLMELKDIDGKPFVKERVELAATKNSFWQDYKFTNPVSKKVEPKSMYCEKAVDIIVCGGIYK